MPELKVTYANGLTDTKGLKTSSVSWLELVGKFRKPKRTPETVSQYHNFNKERKLRIKDVGGIIPARLKDGRRLKANVIDAQILMLDFDEGCLADIWGNFKELGITGMLHTTHSHTTENNRFRIIVPLKRAVTPEEYVKVGIGLTTQLGTTDYDKTTFQPERIMFYPSVSSDGKYLFYETNNDWLDPNEYPGVGFRKVNTTAEPEHPADKEGIIGAFCSKYDIHTAISEFIPDIYTPCEERGDGYYTYVNGSASGGFYVYPSGVHAYSHHNTDPANIGHAVNAFDLVRIHKFRELDKRAKKDTPITKLPSFKAMQEFAEDIPEVYAELQDRRAEQVAAEFENGEPSQAPSVLSELLKQISYVDFRKKAGLKSDAKIPQKIYVIICIDETLKEAKVNNWSLCTKDAYVYVYNGSYWQPIDPEDVKTFLAKVALKMGVPKNDARHYEFARELYNQFLFTANLPTPDIDRNKVLINLLNGTFEISPNKQMLREPHREDFLKYQLPFDYDPNAKAPLFDKYLQRVLPDEACREVLAEYIGYVFTVGLKFEKVLMLYGNGANGKSVFFDIVNALLGPDNICSYPLQVLAKEDSYQRAELSNKLLNYASEINGMLEASAFKQLASGEPIDARQIYGKPYIMRDYAKLMFNCNVLPKETEQTNAFFRRFIIIPFNVTIPELEQDPELAQKIISQELSGVFNWALDGLRRLLINRKFTQSDIIKVQIETYKRESDSVAMFIDEYGYVPFEGTYISLKGMYDEYRQYCSENGYYPVHSRNMADRLRRAGFSTKKNRSKAVIVGAEVQQGAEDCGV